MIVKRLFTAPQDSPTPDPCWTSFAVTRLRDDVEPKYLDARKVRSGPVAASIST